MNQIQIARLANHARAENKARVGYPYPNRDKQRTYAKENLPGKSEFHAVLASIKKEWLGCTARKLAELLTGVDFRDDSSGLEVFGAGQYDAQLAAWGLSTRAVEPPAPTSADLQIYDGTWEEPERTKR